MKEPVEILVLEKHVIKFYDETNYTSGFSFNNKKYEKTYTGGDNNCRMTSQIGIEIFEDKKLKSSCLIGAVGGGTGMHLNASLISNGGLVICCSNTVFKLTIPDLNLEWKTVADWATCFGIYFLDKDYIVHGEVKITRLNKDGKILWQQGGADIFTTMEGTDNFVITDNYILVTDCGNREYKFYFNGNSLN